MIDSVPRTPCSRELGVLVFCGGLLERDVVRLLAGKRPNAVGGAGVGRLGYRPVGRLRLVRLLLVRMIVV